MVLKSEIENLLISEENYYNSKFVTPEEITRFEKSENELRYKLMNLISDYGEIHGYKRVKTIEMFAEECRTSETTLKKCINGTQPISRKLLYKISVGLKMNLEKVNELFALCGGVLTRSDKLDYICINALRDNDDIDFFIDQVYEFTKVKLVNKNSI